MSKNATGFDILHAYYSAAGESDIEAARHARRTVVSRYVSMAFTTLMTFAIIGVIVITSVPMFALAGTVDRMHTFGWYMFAALVVTAYFPYKAKFIGFWIAYGLTLVPIFVLIAL